MSEDRLPIGEDPITVDHPLVHAPGVFFGLDEEAYHSAFALSATGIKALRISSLDFWSRCPSLNPDCRDEDTEAKLIGRCYDARIVEGKAVFDARYAAALDKRDYPDAVVTNDEIRAAIKRADGSVKGITSLKKSELVEVLTGCDPHAVVWDTILSEHIAQHPGKTLLPAETIRRIEIAAAMIEAHPQLSKAFTGGVAQPSVFWVDEETGVPCKSRFDYWKPRALVDLKSFESKGISLDRAIARAFATYKYNIQSAFYLRAWREAKSLIDRGLVYGDYDHAVLNSLREPPEITFLFVWQAKGPAPVAKGKILAPGPTLDIGNMEVDEALIKWARCWQTFGQDPWIEISEIETWDDTEFPVYLTE